MSPTGAGSISASHAYADAGVFTLTCRIQDGTGGSQVNTYRYVVVRAVIREVQAVAITAARGRSTRIARLCRGGLG